MKIFRLRRLPQLTHVHSQIQNILQLCRVRGLLQYLRVVLFLPLCNINHSTNREFTTQTSSGATTATVINRMPLGLLLCLHHLSVRVPSFILQSPVSLNAWLGASVPLQIQTINRSTPRQVDRYIPTEQTTRQIRK